MTAVSDELSFDRPAARSAPTSCRKTPPNVTATARENSRRVSGPGQSRDIVIKVTSSRLFNGQESRTYDTWPIDVLEERPNRVPRDGLIDVLPPSSRGRRLADLNPVRSNDGYISG